jgi:hypothetical protein
METGVEQFRAQMLPRQLATDGAYPNDDAQHRLAA